MLQWDLESSRWSTPALMGPAPFGFPHPIEWPKACASVCSALLTHPHQFLGSGLLWIFTGRKRQNRFAFQAKASAKRSPSPRAAPAGILLDLAHQPERGDVVVEPGELATRDLPSGRMLVPLGVALGSGLPGLHFSFLYDRSSWGKINGRHASRAMSCPCPLSWYSFIIRMH